MTRSRIPSKAWTDGTRSTNGGVTQPGTAQSIGFLLDDTARLFRRAFNARTRSIGITALQWRVMAYLLRNQPLRQSEFAEIIEVEPITLSRMIDRLVSADFVERRPHPSDRRAKLLFLTARGHELLAALPPVTATIAEEATEGLSDTERGDLVELVERVRANLSRFNIEDRRRDGSAM